MLVLSLISGAFADDTFVQLSAETVVQMPELAVDERLKVLIDKPKTERVSVSMFAEATPNYGEIYLGPTLHLKKLALNVSLGIETAGLPPARRRFRLLGEWSLRHLGRHGVRWLRPLVQGLRQSDLQARLNRLLDPTLRWLRPAVQHQNARS